MSSPQNYQHQPKPHHHFDFHLPIPPSPSTFSLEKAVCTHGLFLMAPNQWDPQTKSLLRPLHLSPSTSAMVRVSSTPGSVLIRVYGVTALSEEEQSAVEGQVRRMLRLSEGEERKVVEFQELHGKAKEDGFGRVFRSPTLFEDMVKAILFCNCQWPRTLSMAKALCDLQFELQSRSSKESVDELGKGKPEVAASRPESFTPATPAMKESLRKRKIQIILSEEVRGGIVQSEGDDNITMTGAQTSDGVELKKNFVPTFMSSNKNGHDEMTYYCLAQNASLDASAPERVGNFPNAKEIASLDEKYLAKRCGLGYRAGRISKLAQGVVEDRIQLSQLEELCSETTISNCLLLEEKLKEINGYGPFTRGNVLMCMGFYNVVPTDSETIRHLKQVHARKTTIQTVQKVVEEMYGKYEPYQFLAYWWELWSFYEGWFGKFSEMPSSRYKLVTASNMKTKSGTVKHAKPC